MVEYPYITQGESIKGINAAFKKYDEDCFKERVFWLIFLSLTLITLFICWRMGYLDSAIKWFMEYIGVI